MRRQKKTLTSALAIVCAGAMLLGALQIDKVTTGGTLSAAARAEAETITAIDGGILDTHTEELFDPSVVYELTDTVKADTEISVILKLSDDTLLDAFENAGANMTFSDYLTTAAAMKAKNAVTRSETKLVKKLNRSGVDYTMGETYDTVLSGFEVTIKAGDFSALAAAVPEAELIVGEEYEECETQVVTNDVDVYDTGIFDSSASQYQGDGVVVAVLDTGLDYTHSAFAVENFERDENVELAYTKDKVESEVAGLHAAMTTADLTADDVYINEKVPYAYDYADKDTDVFPINSEHGTHVSGVITANDREITGVAPSAQLMMMKVFSESSSGAKTSWILAALEDCVKLGVDVINMSLGSACGFSREVDKDATAEMYDRIEEAGISLVCAASNDYNSTMGSEKNGSLGLTSNPDSGTVGSPSTYEASMSVASVSGVTSNYIKYGDTVMYFNEATDSTATTRSFVDDLLTRMGKPESDMGTYSVPFEVIPGLGRNSDYSKDSYEGEIVIVKRGTTTFEEKIRIAMSKGALGIIIYNNVSGTISMSIGSNADAAACSISQDDGEILAAAGEGYLTIGRSQEAGPFMSDFSSWGPTSDLRIKPEITAHGGEIYSCIPGGGYERLSGTSMASPNQAGVTALIRQYVKDPANEKKFGLTGLEGTDYNLAVTAAVNQLMMSTADIIYNQNGLPYSVRKQGSGLVNLYSAQEADAYIVTLDSSGEEMDKAKIELGDDRYRDEKGVYTMTFRLKNISDVPTEYRVGGIVQTEGVSATYTSHGDTTVTQDGETLSGATTEVTGISGGTRDGDKVTVQAGGTAEITVRISLSDADMEYLEDSFENGMYVEGFITLEELSGTDNENFVDLSVPFLAFYGDWTKAPIFDEEYYDTNVDEINSGLDDADKLMADAYATRVVGGLYDDYIAYMGSYYFIQDPSMPQVAASKDHIAMSNQSDSSNYNVNNLVYVYAGLLRNVGEIDITITEDSTGKTIYTNTVYNQRKSYGASSIYTSAIDMEGFSAYDYNLKNNTQYTVTLEAYLDYVGKDEQKNARNVFSFPLFIDYEAPVLTGVEFRKEYDSTTKKTSLYADLSIYDNHYAMAAQTGTVTRSEDPQYLFSLSAFGGYATPISSSFNSTTIVSVELTDYIEDMKGSSGYLLFDDGTYEITDDTNSFIVILYDYALNTAIYEVNLPDEIISMYFGGTYGNSKTEVGYVGGVATVTLELNETLDLTEILNVYPSTSWVQVLNYESSSPEKVAISGQTILALDYTEGSPVMVTVTGYNSSGEPIYAYLNVNVEGNASRYTLPVVNSFSLTGYYVEKAFYSMYSDEREIGYEGYTYTFDSDPALSMFPSECVDVSYNLQTYFPNDTYVEFSVANSAVASVITREDGTGVITAQSEGSTTVTATVYYKDPDTGRETSQRTARISVTVKDPFTVNSIYLMSYKGLGGEVEIPDDRGITTIYQYAFSNYEYVAKDLNAGDVIDEEDPYNTKPWFIGDDTITKVIIPEGVVEIQGYAFANLTALEEVVFPSTLSRIGYGAFYNCTSLKKITYSGADNVQFINESAFDGCVSLEDFNFSSVVAIGKNAFRGCSISTLYLNRYCQSIAEGAFRDNKYLFDVDIRADSIKLDSYAFYGCVSLGSITINASVIPSYAFYGCSSLSSVTLGKDVSVINAYAFYGTNVSKFTLSSQNTYLKISSDGTMIYSDDYATLQVVAPKFSSVTGSTAVKLNEDTTTISNGAFTGTGVTSVTGGKVKYIKDYAFAGCSSLSSVSFGTLEEIGAYAFYNTKISSVPNFSGSCVIGDWAFARTSMKNLTITSGVTVGAYAFYSCSKLTSLSVGDGCTLGEYSFYGCKELASVEVGKNCVIGDFAFAQDLIPDYDTWYAAYGSSSASTYWENYGKNVYEEYTYYLTDESGNEVVDNDGNSINASDYIYVEGYTGHFFAYDLSNATSGKLQSVKIGNGTQIGTGAFENCATLTCLTLGSEKQADIVVGDYAFFNCVSINGGNFSFENVLEIGAYAFSVMDDTRDVMYPVSDEYNTAYISNLTFAYEFVFMNGDDEPTYTGYKYTAQCGAFSGTLDLSSVIKIGEGAFARNSEVTGVILGDKIYEVPAYAFYKCGGLETIKRASDEESEGGANLSDIGFVGDYAFAYTKISSVILQDGMILSDGAFYMCGNLTEAENLCDVLSIGAYAFAYTAIGSEKAEIDISGAVYVGDYAFAYVESENTIHVDFLGENEEGFGALEEIGENPFLSTDVEFSVYESENFGSETYTEKTDTYAISGAAFVSEGVLYENLQMGTEDDPKVGYVLITYPVGKTDSSYTVLDNTVRISAHAFDGNKNLSLVTLSSALSAVGDKAFYGCDNLSVVVFTSYYAPALEEEYDENYYGLVANYPGQYVMTSYYRGLEYGYYYEGLGILDFASWSSGPNNYFYGANFVGYIGKLESKLTMIVPVNGQYYDSFTLAQYFDTVIYGAAAASPDTLEVIAMIAKLPLGNITLEDADDIYAALSAYNALSPEQQALVTNYSDLTQAYGYLQFLEYGSESEDEEIAEKKSSSSFMKDNMWGLIIALVILLAFVALLVYTILEKKKVTEGAGEGTESEMLKDSSMEGEGASVCSGGELSSAEGESSAGEESSDEKLSSDGGGSLLK
ncbi:MAG: leucine-rich repeat protein [Clostridia bacterium]|nr:leucine-rich repeat protein [Clostridia bacterium]